MTSEQQARIDAILVWNKSTKIGSENMPSQIDLSHLQDIVIDLAHKSVRPYTLELGHLLETHMTPVIGAIIGSIGLTTALDGINESHFEDGRTEFDIESVIGAGFDLDVDSSTLVEVHVEKKPALGLFDSIKPYNY
jgi:hypothetical protein